MPAEPGNAPRPMFWLDSDNHLAHGILLGGEWNAADAGAQAETRSTILKVGFRPNSADV